MLRNDKRAIFVAATKAQHAADYLLARLQPSPVRKRSQPDPVSPCRPTEPRHRAAAHFILKESTWTTTSHV